MMCGDIHDIKQYCLGQKDIAFTKSLCFILTKMNEEGGIFQVFDQNKT